MLNDDIDDDYGDGFSDEIGDDPDPPQGTQTLEQRKAVHEAFEIFEQKNGDERAPYTVLCGKRVYDLGVCRHVDIQQIVGEWIWGQLVLKNHDVIKFPVHVLRNSKLRYIYTAKDIEKTDEITTVLCEKVTVPAGMIQEALLEEMLIGFRFMNKADEDRENEP